MQLYEFFLGEMSEADYQLVAQSIKDQFKSNGILLVLTDHIMKQTVYNPDPRRAAAVTPKTFSDMFSAVLKAFQSGKMNAALAASLKKPESHLLFKRKVTLDRRPTVANMPCAIAKINTPPYEYKFTIITFMLKDHYQNDSFPQDSVMWI